MAINYAKVAQLRLEAIDAVTDRFTKEIERVANELGRRMDVAIRTGANASSLTDAAIARAQAQQIMLDSGFYRATGNLFGSGYQRIINQSYESYTKYYPSALQFDGVDTTRLNILRQASTGVFDGLAADQISNMQRVLVNVNFGTMDILQASEYIRANVEDRIKSQAYTIANTNTHAFSRQANVEIAKAAGLEKYIYTGPQDKITRKFCRDHIGVVKTIDKWEKLVAPDSPGPVPIYGGGYNCRHEIVPILEEDDVEVE